MKRIALFLICFASLIIIGCDKKNSNTDMADEAEQPFVMKTPKTGNLPFETLTVNQDGGQYYISALTEKKEGVSVLMMAFSFDERTKAGEAISIDQSRRSHFNRCLLFRAIRFKWIIRLSAIRRESIPKGKEGKQPCAPFQGYPFHSGRGRIPTERRLNFYVSEKKIRSPSRQNPAKK